MSLDDHMSRYFEPTLHGLECLSAQLTRRTRQGHSGDQVVRMLDNNSLHQSDARLTSLAFARGIAGKICRVMHDLESHASAQHGHTYFNNGCR